MTHNQLKENGVTHAPLVTEYPIEWAEVPEGKLEEGEYFERGLIKFDNGYGVSILRTNVNRDGLAPSIGHEDGLWETFPIRNTDNISLLLAGMTYEPATEFDEFLNYTATPEDFGMTEEFPDAEPQPVGRFNDAQVNSLIAVVELQADWRVLEEQNPFEALLQSLMGAPE